MSFDFDFFFALLLSEIYDNSFMVFSHTHSQIREGDDVAAISLWEVKVIKVNCA